MKIKALLRNKKLEQELQKKILKIMESGKYDNVPMLFMNGLKIYDCKDKIYFECLEKDLHFIWSRNIFMGKRHKI